jgi:hypothetical protein
VIANRASVEYLLLADAVQVVDGKLYVTGGGFDAMLVPAVPQTAQLAIACGVLVPWAEAEKEHTLTVSVASADRRPLAPPHRETFRTGRASGLLPGAPVHVPFAITWELTFPDYGRYAVIATVDAYRDTERRCECSVRPAPGAEPVISEAEMNVIDEELSAEM